MFTAILLGSTAPVAAGSLRVDVHGRVSGVTGTAEVVLQESPPGQSFGRFFGSLGLTAFLDPFACVAGADLALCPDLPVTSTTSGDDGRFALGMEVVDTGRRAAERATFDLSVRAAGATTSVFDLPDGTSDVGDLPLWTTAPEIIDPGPDLPLGVRLVDPPSGRTEVRLRTALDPDALFGGATEVLAADDDQVSIVERRVLADRPVTVTGSAALRVGSRDASAVTPAADLVVGTAPPSRHADCTLGEHEGVDETGTKADGTCTATDGAIGVEALTLADAGRVPCIEVITTPFELPDTAPTITFPDIEVPQPRLPEPQPVPIPEFPEFEFPEPEPFPFESGSRAEPDSRHGATVGLAAPQRRTPGCGVRHVTIDLGEPMPIGQVVLLGNPLSGVTVHVSDDGETWHPFAAGTRSRELPAAIAVVGDAAADARYVRVADAPDRGVVPDFPYSVVSEIEVWGPVPIDAPRTPVGGEADSDGSLLPLAGFAGLVAVVAAFAVGMAMGRFRRSV